MPFTGNAGASHGGRGGHGDSSSIVGHAYGLLAQPRRHGSGSATSKGGGIIRLVARQDIAIDGLVTAAGQAGKRAGGGASGGSIWLQTSTLTGGGTVRTSGGSGLSNGGGGAGGRMAVEFRNSTFHGKFETFGGAGVSECGGAGTLLITDNSNNKTKLVLDNNNVCSPRDDDIQDFRTDGGRTWISEAPQTESITFGEVKMRGKAHLAVSSQANKNFQIIVGKISGDRSGIFHVVQNQKLKLSFEGEGGKEPELLWGVNVYPKGDLSMSTNLVVYGIKIIVAGSLSGARNVTVGDNGRLILRCVRFLCFYQSKLKVDKSQHKF